MLEVKTTGLAELEKALAELPAKLERNVVRGGLRAGAKVIEAEAKQLVPVRTGRLRDSIKASSGTKRGKPYARIKVGGRGNGKDSVWYAHIVELTGAVRHFIKPKKASALFISGSVRKGVEHPGMQSRPFMRPALDRAGPRAVAAFADYVRGRLTKEGINVPDPTPTEFEE